MILLWINLSLVLIAINGFNGNDIGLKFSPIIGGITKTKDSGNISKIYFLVSSVVVITLSKP